MTNCAWGLISDQLCTLQDEFQYETAKNEMLSDSQLHTGVHAPYNVGSVQQQQDYKNKIQ